MKALSLPLVLAAVLLALAVLLRIIDPGPIARLRLSVFDSYLELSPRIADPDRTVRVVTIDEPSLERLGQWPWRRAVLAEIIERLGRAGAKVVAVDLIFPEPDRLSPQAIARALASSPGADELRAIATRLPDGDERLGQAVAAAPVVLGFAGDDTAPRGPGAARAGFAFAGDPPQAFVASFAAATSSLPVITGGARGLGAVNWLPERDQVVRRVPLLVAVGNTLYPSLSLEALRIALGETTVFVKSSGGSGITALGQRTGIELVRVGRTVLPTTPSGELWLRFSRPDRDRALSAYRVLEPDFDPKEVAGLPVVIGASAVGLLDLRATPLASAVPGVEIHAQALEQMLAGDHLIRPAHATGAEIVFLIGCGLLLAWLIGRSGPVVAALVGAASVAVVIALSWLAYVCGGLLLDPIYPSIALAAIYVAGSLSSYVRTELERTRIRSAFSHYVAAPIVDELASHPEKLRLGGEMREITLLFADVRGFSQIAEGLDAESLIRFVNALFTPMSEVILEQRGTIDKFMGDAVMAFWNAPVADPDHARHACHAALAMLAALDRLNADWRQEAAARGKAPRDVRIGIGLNTGRCCVGNVGSPQRFDYSILGDAVNVAARLEAATKTYLTPIIAGSQTEAAAADLAFLEIDRVALQGRDTPEAVFALLGDEALAVSPTFRRLKQHHADLLAALRDDNVADARAALAACIALDLARYEPLATYFQRRLDRLNRV